MFLRDYKYFVFKYEYIEKYLKYFFIYFSNTFHFVLLCKYKKSNTYIETSSL